MEGGWFVKLLLLTVQRTWALLTGGVESLFYLKHWSRGHRIIANARDLIRDTAELERFYKEMHVVEYRRDWLDRWSFPWVTAVKRKGDCEDFMTLSYAIMKEKAKCVRTALYGRRDGKRGGHAVLIVRESGGWVLMSNMHRYIWFDNPHDAARKHYGKDTTRYYFLDRT